MKQPDGNPASGQGRLVTVDHAIEAMTCNATATRARRDGEKWAAAAEYHASMLGREDFRRKRDAPPPQFHHYPQLEDAWRKGHHDAEVSVLLDGLGRPASIPTCVNVVGSTDICGQIPKGNGKSCDLCGRVGRL
ncbi:hypothetical protein QZM25_30870 [Burkholderia contaminans]|uniref:hypothetical protein n=1 Tax=Burkholderia contaminans TaxID=488447 RepID=UPI00264F7B38|nr:hypothetical protein [Burkholderia contaminans]MDN7577018.1 hypothetical protein [Burkholderia contaminans]